MKTGYKMDAPLEGTCRMYLLECAPDLVVFGYRTFDTRQTAASNSLISSYTPMGGALYYPTSKYKRVHVIAHPTSFGLHCISVSLY